MIPCLEDLKLYLKSLELHGFKSFPEKTVLNFNSGSTVIVGPNGSGKSNITDAMRWVLGELSSRNIRGNKMEDVIFAGANDKKPMSFAEVSVTFDNSGEPKLLKSDYDEVTVTRRYFRSGDSQYFINRKRVRLKDIFELFMNTGIGREGYSIIGQGKIAEILSKKSEDRRTVFEESAGISGFRHKLNDSQRKLSETEINMSRVEDIESELAKRIGPLERESEKARKYLDLYGEKKKVDVSLWIYESDRIKNSLEKAESNLAISKHELEMADDSLKITSEKVSRLEEMYTECNEKSNLLYSEIISAKENLANAKTDAVQLSERKTGQEEQIIREKSALEKSGNDITNEDNKIAEINKTISQKESDISSEQEVEKTIISEIEAKNNIIKDLSEKIDSLLLDKQSSEKALTDHNIRYNVIVNNVEEEKKRIENIENSIEEYNAKISELSKSSEAAKTQMDVYDSEIKSEENIITDLKSDIETVLKKKNDTDNDERSALIEYEALNSRVSALKRMHEHFDGYYNSVKYIMNEAKNGNLNGIRGPLSHLIKVEDKFILAIETTLGSALQNIVTDDEDSAKKAIELLKINNAGRATFYPITTVQPQNRNYEIVNVSTMNGFLGWGDSLVKCGSEYDNIISSLLSRVAVFDNLDNATVAAKSTKWKLRAVTLDGQQINSGGSFTGGQAKKDSGVLQRNAQIDSLSKELKDSENKLDEIRKNGKIISEELDNLNDKLSSSEERVSIISSLRSAEEKAYVDAESEIKAISGLIEVMQNDKDNLSSNDVTAEIETIKSDIKNTELLIESVESQRTSLAADMGDVEITVRSLESDLQKSRIRIAQLTAERDSLKTNLEDLNSHREALVSEFELHKNKINAAEIKIEELAKTAKTRQDDAHELEDKVKALEAERFGLVEKIDDIGAKRTKLRELEVEQNNKRNLIFESHSKNESALEKIKDDDDKLSARMWEDYELTYASALTFADENSCHVIVEGKKATYENMAKDLKAKIKSLGHVNIDSIDEYIEVKDRYGYIKTQLDDLRNSKDNLIKVISEIEQGMKTQFSEAFVKINKYFNEVFRELFGGGHAEVILSDPENPLESGIEINAAPPGKTIKNLNLLSGGEQAFIAIALMFALIKVNPSPFCIFDEIEAALDEANVARVARYVKNYSKEMQIIMITHRRGTMDIADTLYGVTMQQSGVSRVFTLKTGDSADEFLK